LKGKTVFTRLRLSLAACLVLVAAGVFITAASAAGEGGGQAAGPVSYPGLDGYTGDAFNPQETNVPYLAWRGEEVRLVKCSDDIPAPSSVLPNQTLLGFLYGNRASIFIEDWSGTQVNNSFEGPKPVADTFVIFRDNNESSPHFGENCLRADFISNKPGLAVIKMSASDDRGVQQVVHSFLVGWMAVDSANITNPAPVTELPGAEPGNSVNVQVTGQIPMNSEFQSDWGLPDPLVLPNDWAEWANAMATTDNELTKNGLAPAAFWDIHDSSGPDFASEAGDGGNPDVHVSQTSCPLSTPSDTIDQVDNCDGRQYGRAFSRVFGDFGLARGPFDPSYPATLLSDGNLNAHDAPLPPLKIVFNSSGGMGGFDNSILNDKRCVYNRDSDLSNGVCGYEDNSNSIWSQNAFSAHSLYAPNYATSIPATSRNPWGVASGTDGPVYGCPENDNINVNLESVNGYCTGQPNNFAGYGIYGDYQYWKIAQYLSTNYAQDTICRLRGDQMRQSNGLPTSVVEYTDEHGEARAQWQPGFGNDNFGTTAGVANEQGGCDLQGVNFAPQTITAAARYPFQTVSRDIAATGSITKNIQNLFNKSVSCVRKTTLTEYRCTVKAQDIDGSGDIFNGEQVCLVRDPDLGDASWLTVPDGDLVPNGYCVTLSGGTQTNHVTGEVGKPATGVLDTDATHNGQQIDVAAHFKDEHLVRDTCIITGQPVSLPGPCPGTGGGVGASTGSTGSTGSSTGSTGSTGSSTGSTGSTGGVSSLHKTNKATKASSVQSVQVVVTKHGRVLMVKIHSINKTAKIQIRLINAKGKVVTVVVRTVKTNKRVQVPNIRIGKNVKNIKVKALT